MANHSEQSTPVISAFNSILHGDALQKVPFWRAKAMVRKIISMKRIAPSKEITNNVKRLVTDGVYSISSLNILVVDK